MRTPSATTSMDRPVNLLRATTTCNTFYIFLSAAKAALLPFLTLFFRLLGLSALQTGVVMAAKTLTGFLWAPLWARCAVSYNKRRTVLVFSLLMMGAMYMAFPAVYYKVGDLRSCRPPGVDQAQKNQSRVAGGAADGVVNAAGNPSLGAATIAPVVANTKVPGAGKPTTTVHPGARPHTSHAATQPDSGTEPPHTTKAPLTTPAAPVATAPTKLATAAANSAAKSAAAAISTARPNAIESDAGQPSKVGHHTPPASSVAAEQIPLQNNSGRAEQNSQAEVDAIENNLKQLTGYSFQDIKTSGISARELYAIAKAKMPTLDVTEQDLQTIIDYANAHADDAHHDLRRSTHRTARNLNFTFFNDLKDKFGVLTSTLEEKKLVLFVVVLLVIIFGEFFSSPVEKIADDAWFDFLERIDDMEKYGRQRYWGSLTFALVPIVVACLVDYTPCEMMFQTHHFLLHFYVFALFLVFTLLLAFYFPMPPPLKQKYSSKVGKGLRIICCDRRGCLFLITLLVGGAVYASFNNFLFWRLQDLGAGEVTMGLCVSVGAFAETPMLVFSNRLVRKMGHAGVVSLALLVLALRVLYYGFLWTPWAVLPAELTNAFTHTALWYAVLSYDEFNVGSAMDRSIRSILSSVYFGLGFSLGSLASGLVYEVYGASVLFWGASVLSGGWCLVYSALQLCMPKKERVKYIKLLRKAEDESSDGEDDWLEMALKDH